MPEPQLSTVETLKIPPHSIEAEQAVLGGLLLAKGAWEQVADLIVETDFYREDHRLVFRAIAELNESNLPSDAVTVTEWFQTNGKIDLVDGGNSIAQLASSTPSAANIKAYAGIVREKSILRSLIDLMPATGCTLLAYLDPASFDERELGVLVHVPATKAPCSRMR